MFCGTPFMRTECVFEALIERGWRMLACPVRVLNANKADTVSKGPRSSQNPVLGDC